MSKQQAWIGFWILALIWGSSYFFIRIAVRELAPFELVFIRTGIAAVGLNIVLLVTGKRWPRDRQGLGLLVFLGIVNTVLPFALISWSEQHVESGLASVLQATTALFTLVVAHFALADDRITVRKIIGVALGLIGVTILSSKTWAEGATISGEFGGVLAMIAASICYALGGTFARKWSRPTLEPIVVATGAMTIAAVATGLITYIGPYFGGPAPTPLVEMSTDVWQSALILGVLNTLLAYTVFYSVLKVLGPSRMSMITYVLPVVGIALGAMFLNEVVDERLLIGAVFILGGIAVVNLGGMMRERVMGVLKPQIVKTESR
jgi:drug/metabolite transporter (DMT)-like permease